MTAPTQQPAADLVLASLLAGCDNVTDPVRLAVTGVAQLADHEIVGGLLAGASLADDVVALARARNILDYQLARRLHCARTHNDLPADAATVLKAEQWHHGHATDLRNAAGFADRFHKIARMWEIGDLNTTSPHWPKDAGSASRPTTNAKP